MPDQIKVRGHNFPDLEPQNSEEVAEVAQLTNVDSFPKRGIIIAIVAALIAFALYNVLPFEPNVKKGLALLAFIAIMWLTEAVHITITALMVPVLAVAIGIGKFGKDGEFTALTLKNALANFANPTIFTFFGGFALATALHMQKLDKKIATWLIQKAGGRLGVAAILICITTALLSMWVSNTATAAMMLPLALGICANLDERKKEDRGTIVFLLLGIAYSASIGGLGTIVGSPPNIIAAEALGWNFADWMKVGLPLMLLMLPLMLVVLYLVFRPNLNHKVEIELEEIPWNRQRILTVIVFVITAFAWIFSKDISKVIGFKIDDSYVAVCAAIAVVMLGLAKWHDVAENTEWGVLMLFGGGLTLSAVLGMSGASGVLGNLVANTFKDAPVYLVLLVTAVFIICLTEFTSNTASAALLVPVFAGVASHMGLPKETLTIVIGIGASCAFVMPVATPPNALVFGTGKIKQMDMIKAGAYLAFAGAVIVSLYVYLFFA